MKVKIKLDTDWEIEAEIPEEELKKLDKPVKKTGYERVKPHNDYYTVSAEGRVNKDMCDFGFGTACYDVANYYSDPIVAENNARADKLMRQLRRFAVERREFTFDWHENDYYEIYWDFHDRNAKIKVNVVSGEKYFGTIAFHSKETAELAVKEFHDELTWYFTEYKDSL